jgi:hypothetical protein
MEMTTSLGSTTPAQNKERPGFPRASPSGLYARLPALVSLGSPSEVGVLTGAGSPTEAEGVSHVGPIPDHTTVWGCGDIAVPA